MPLPANGPQKSFAAQDVDTWLLDAQERCAALHLKAAGSWQSAQCLEAYTDMSALFQAACEEVRVVSESLREGSHVVRGESADLQAHATQLRERGKALMERIAQFALPSAEEVQEAESRLLAMFKGEGRPSES